MADQHLADSSEKANLHRRAAAPDTAGSETADAPHPLLRLQGQVGNATIARLLAQRADEEEEVQAKHDALAQRAEEEEEVQAKHDGLAQRAEEEEEVQAKHETVGVEGGAVGPDTETRIQAMRGAGSPLESSTRASMESSFGTSFKDVRVHTSGDADALNRRLTARAFTTGNDIFLRGDASPGDSRLLAHELSHVVQQRSMGGGGGGMRVGAAGDAHERQADAIADVVTSSNTSQVQAMPVQRQGAEDEEVQAEHDLAQRQAEEEEEVQAEHDLAQRDGEEEQMA